MYIAFSTEYKTQPPVTTKLGRARTVEKAVQLFPDGVKPMVLEDPKTDLVAVGFAPWITYHVHSQ